MNEIFNGCEDFQGLKDLVEQFLEHNKDEVEIEAKEVGFKIAEQVLRTTQYLCDISSGKVPTNSSIMREFILKHPKYNKDSEINEVRIFFLSI